MDLPTSTFIFSHSIKYVNLVVGTSFVLKTEIVHNILGISLNAEVLLKEFADSYCCVTGLTLLAMKQIFEGHNFHRF